MSSSHGTNMEPIEVSITIRMYQKSSGPYGINLSHDFQLPPMDFLRLAGIMKRFHDLCSEIKSNQ